MTGFDLLRFTMRTGPRFRVEYGPVIEMGPSPWPEGWWRRKGV